MAGGADSYLAIGVAAPKGFRAYKGGVEIATPNAGFLASDVAFSPDGVYLAVGGDGQVDIFKRTGDAFAFLVSLQGTSHPSGAPNAIMWDCFGQDLIIACAGSFYGNFAMYRRTGDTFAKTPGVAVGVVGSGACYDAGFTVDGLFAWAVSDGTISVWWRDNQAGAWSNYSQAVGSGHRSGIVLPDETFIAYNGGSGFTVRKGFRSGSISGGAGPFSPSGMIIRRMYIPGDKSALYVADWNADPNHKVYSIIGGVYTLLTTDPDFVGNNLYDFWEDQDQVLYTTQSVAPYYIKRFQRGGTPAAPTWTPLAALNPVIASGNTYGASAAPWNGAGTAPELPTKVEGGVAPLPMLQTIGQVFLDERELITGTAILPAVTADGVFIWRPYVEGGVVDVPSITAEGDVRWRPYIEGGVVSTPMITVEGEVRWLSYVQGSGDVPMPKTEGLLFFYRDRIIQDGVANMPGPQIVGTVYPLPYLQTGIASLPMANVEAVLLYTDPDNPPPKAKANGGWIVGIGVGPGF